jgi:flagellar motility protein MotE (MotC chaperone)
MDEEEKLLNDLKSKMTDQQQQDMREILQAELKRRMDEKNKAAQLGRSREKSTVKSSQLSGGLDQQHLGEMYADLDGDIRTLRLRKLERQLAEAKSQARKYGKFMKPKKAPVAESSMDAGNGDSYAGAPHMGQRRMENANLRGLFLMAGIVGLAALKVIFSTGVVDASSALQNTTVAPKAVQNQAQNENTAADTDNAERSAVTTANVASVSVPELAGEFQHSGAYLSESEKQVLTSLDARRVELEKRRTALDQKETELKNQSQALAERIAELRSLTSKLADLRKEKDSRYEARLEQLANVYGSMVPKEAAPLIGKLDEGIALALLERMPGKRMGQILSVMEPDRAVELTKSLTDKGKL